MHKAKRTGIAGIIITIIILIIIVILSNIQTNQLSYIETAVGTLVMPIQNGLTYLKNKIVGNNAFFTDINNLKQENEELKTKNSELEQSLRELEIIKSENATLKEYVNLKDKYTEYNTVPAYVINKDISNYSDVMIINVGSKDGIEVNMPVISDQGLVGHILSVTETTAKVQTIVDTSSTISCTITTSRDTIIARGTLEEESTLKATYIPTDATVLQGDTVETSGLGGIYPKGILIGTIKQVTNTKNITDRYATIETAVDFSKVETVLVIK
mgnify:CR=1 FL=1